MTEKLLKAVLNSTHKHTLLPFSFTHKIGHKYARTLFDTVPDISHNAIINIDFPLLVGIYMCFPVFWLFSGISVLSVYDAKPVNNCFRVVICLTNSLEKISWLVQR